MRRLNSFMCEFEAAHMFYCVSAVWLPVFAVAFPALLVSELLSGEQFF